MEVATIWEIEDDFCNDWGEIVQDGILQCPPKMGDVSISSSWLSVFTENPYDREEVTLMNVSTMVFFISALHFVFAGVQADPEHTSHGRGTDCLPRRRRHSHPFIVHLGELIW